MIKPRRSPDQKKTKHCLHFENEPVSFRHNYGSASIIEEAFGSFGSMSLSRRQGSEVTSPAGTEASQSLSTLQYGAIARWALAAHRPVPCNTLRKKKRKIFWTSVASHDRLLHNGIVKRRAAGTSPTRMRLYGGLSIRRSLLRQDGTSCRR